MTRAMTSTIRKLWKVWPAQVRSPAGPSSAMTAGFRARATKSRPTKVADTPATAAKKSCHAVRAAKRSSTAPPKGRRGMNAHATAGAGSRQDSEVQEEEEGAGQDQRP